MEHKIKQAFKERREADCFDIGYLRAIADMSLHLWQTGFGQAAAEVLGQADDHSDVYELVSGLPEKYEEPFRQFVFETYE